ncbi:hypothetical protein KDD30_23180 (plasmid) [Photobacterium sp. GJ3]|uniref:hypothetical protein n=1 Tax=Photobacterium sp. GJ3 TaxID=2829502 RepID=UPI001B8BC2FC|nr:hypothetical protein [Photobacterium sp. GJ3]QUJ69639.1 hypothetical protein KDD30_23180 [Photobacterium sp. GJ3]
MLSTHFTPLPSIAANAFPMPVQRTTGDLPFTVEALATDVYAVGKLMAQWPDKSIEREFRCAYAVIEQYGSSGDMQAYRTQFAPFWPDCLPKQPAPMSVQQAQAKALHIINTVLASRYYRYLAKMLEWQLQDIYGNPMYRLVPSEYNMQMLIDTLARSEQNKDSERDTVNTLIVGPLLPDSGISACYASTNFMTSTPVPWRARVPGDRTPALMTAWFR